MKKPTYVIHQDILQSVFLDYNHYCTVYYPVKSNNSKKLLSILNSFGSNFEVESRTHLNDLIDLGVDPNRILFCSPFSQIIDIYKAIEYGVRFFVVESLTTFRALEEFGINYDFIVRIRENLVSGFPKMIGVTQQELFQIVNESSKGNFRGLTYYLNSELNNVDNRRRMIDYSIALLNSLGSGEDKIIDLSGGINAEECQVVFEYVRAIGNYPLLIEPGKGLINPSIDLIATVIAVDELSSIAYLNVGVYNGLADIWFKKRKFEVYSIKESSNKRKYLLSGPTADIVDIVGTYYLPDLKVGDKLILKECGAYTDVLSTGFYGYERRANYVIR